MFATTIALLLLSSPVDAARAPAAEQTRADAGSSSIVLAAVGDVLLDGPLHRQAEAAPDGFLSALSPIGDLLAGADIAYANLEGPLGGGAPAGFPRFNHPDRLADDLVALGVDVVSTANNHSLDRGRRGLERTLDRLDAVGLLHTGTRRSRDEGWFAVLERAGIRVAFVACTFAANGRPDPRRQVLRCYAQRQRLVTLVEELSARDDVDAVVVTPHMGLERLDAPRPKERRLAKQLLRAGAVAVLGAHPHKLHRVERARAGGREGIVAYSLGNFVSGQRSLQQRTGAVLYLRLIKTEQGVHVGEVGYAPLVSKRKGGHTVVEVASAGSAEAAHAARILKGVARVSGADRVRVRSDSPATRARVLSPSRRAARSPSR